MDEKTHTHRMPHSPKWNALKHGLRSAAVLLPGDDVAECQRRRRELFREYNPCTREEAECVERILGHQWRIAYYQRLQAKFRAALNEVAGIHPAAEHICEPDPHRWQHRAMDCTVEEMRLHKMMRADRKTFFELQWMRRHRLIDGAIDVKTGYLDFLGDEEETEATPQEQAPAPETPPAQASPSSSTHGRNLESYERNAPAIPVLRMEEMVPRLLRHGMRGPAGQSPSPRTERASEHPMTGQGR
jgi:hypothetical protein